MDNRKWEANASGTPPTPLASPSIGYPTKGNPIGAVPATKPGEWMWYALTEELRNVILEGGLTPNDTVTQVRDAIIALIKARGNKVVRVASTAAINLAAPGANIDGVAMVAGDSFLEKNHATLALRGIYIWNGAAVPATRATWADVGTELFSGVTIHVREGTVNADTNWQLISPNTENPVIGTDGLTFQQTNGQTIPSATETIQGIAEIATQAETNAGTDDSRFVTPLKLLNSALIGVGQTWQDVTGSRVLGTTYTNSTGKPIQVLFNGSLDASTLTINGTGYGMNDGTAFAFISFIVPNGGTYSLSGASSTVTRWLELR